MNKQKIEQGCRKLFTTPADEVHTWIPGKVHFCSKDILCPSCKTKLEGYELAEKDFAEKIEELIEYFESNTDFGDDDYFEKPLKEIKFKIKEIFNTQSPQTEVIEKRVFEKQRKSANHIHGELFADTKPEGEQTSLRKDRGTSGSPSGGETLSDKILDIEYWNELRPVLDVKDVRETMQEILKEFHTRAKKMDIMTGDVAFLLLQDILKQKLGDDLI